MGKKEIVIVTYDLNNSGAERVLSELSMQWSHTHDVTFWCLERDRFQTQYDLSENVRIIDAKVKIAYPFSYIGYVIELMKYLHNHPRAIVIAFINCPILVVTMCSTFI